MFTKLIVSALFAATAIIGLAGAAAAGGPAGHGSINGPSLSGLAVDAAGFDIDATRVVERKAGCKC